MPIQKSKPPQKGVFVIMPYVNTPSRSEEQLNSYFENHIKRSIEQASLKHEYRVWRSGETFNITDEIIRDLFEADIVIADLSGILPNPNVMYELGVRLALSEKPVILIREKHPDNKRVFDVDSYYVHPYDPLDYSQLEKHLIGKLKRLESGEERFESPVKKIIQDELILSSSSFSSLRPEEQREILLRGVKIVSDKIATAFGPQGVGVSIMNEKGEDLFTTNGFEIATAAWSPNPLERRGISLLVSLAKAQKSIAGDGTKTAMILACGMMESAQEAMKKGWMPKDLVSGMQKAVDNTIEFLQKSTDTKLNKLRFLQIATTAAKDNIIAEILVDLLDKVGKDGQISFQTGTSKEDIIEIVEDLTFDRGYVSPHFRVRSDSNEIHFEECYILISPYKINLFSDIVPILEKVLATRKPLLVIAEDVEDEALEALVQNAQKKVLSCVVVKAPGFGDRRLDFLEDIAVKTGGRVLSRERGLTIQNISLDDLGVADEVTVDSESTYIVGGHGKQDEITARANELRKRISATDGSFDAEQYRLRLARLTGAIGVIKVGGLVFKDVHHRQNSYVSAANTLTQAIKGGIVPGGGIALLRAKERLKDFKKGKPEERLGFEAFAEILDRPLRQLLRNSKIDEDKAIDEILSCSSLTFGFNAEKGKMEDLQKAGIFDSTQVLISGLETALSYTKMALETSSWVTLNRE